MKDYKYLIIGGGMTADAAVKGIREMDSSGTIGIITEESFPPYDRPPLSKGLWMSDQQEESIFLHTEKYKIDLQLNQKVNKIDKDQRIVHTDQKISYRYDKLLLATGGRPRRLRNDIPEVIYFRNLKDYHELKQKVAKYDNFVIIGGGFIGAELAASLNTNKKQVTIIFPEKGIGGLIFPETHSQFLNSFYAEKGIKIVNNELVTKISKENNEIHVVTDKDRVITTDCVIAGLGIIPNTELAEAANLDVKNGIVINQYCQTSDENIFAAGDVANIYNEALQKRIRAEHDDNSKTMGFAAGKNMAGGKEAYTYLSLFYSDLYEFGYEAVGEISSKYRTFINWVEEPNAGIIYYLDNDKIRGILLWGIFGQVDAARELIREQKTYTSASQLKSMIVPKK